MGEIYKITNLVNDKCYVGKTKYESVIRWRDHINGYHPSSLIHKAIVKYGVDNFKFEILEHSVSEDKLNDLERYYIELCRSKTPNGYNLTNGGDGGLGLLVSEETRRKQSEIRKGKAWSENRRKAGQYKLVGNNNAGKQVAMIKDGTILATFNSISEASIKTGIYRTNINRSCSHLNLKAGGYHWQYI